MKENISGYRFSGYYHQKRAEALALSQVLMGFPVSLEIIRGLDLCTDEEGVPVWVLAPLVRYVRDAGKVASNNLDRLLGHVVPPLHMTAHVGEDFTHLLSGLRRIDDTIQYLGLVEGDRLGHAVALGVDATEWATGRGQVLITREERLWDLVCEWTFSNRTGAAVSGVRRSLVEREVARLSHQIFGSDGPNLYELECLKDDLHDEHCLRDVRYPSGPVAMVAGLSRRQRLLVRYLTDPVVFTHGQVLEMVHPYEESELLEIMQCGLRQFVRDLGLAIEINPSSNLLIGDLRDLGHHPLWRLCPPTSAPWRSPLKNIAKHVADRRLGWIGGGKTDDVGPTAAASDALLICVGSDDPLSFATNLLMEYQLLWDAMTEGGISPRACVEWVRHARDIGMRWRFTLRRSGFTLEALCSAELQVIDEIL